MDCSDILKRVEKLSEVALVSSGSVYGNLEGTRNNNNELELVIQSMRDPSLRAEAGNIAYYLLENASNGYGKWIALTIFEDFVKLSWYQLDGQRKKLYHDMLFRYLSQNHALLENYVLQKLIKVQVDVGKRDWPADYPDLFAKIHALVSEPTTCSVGFEFIKVFCEEVNSSKENLPFERKSALKTAFLTEVPSILHVCCSFLDIVYEKIAIYPATTTPNPSPLSKSQTIKSPMADKLLKHAFFNFDPNNTHVSQSLPNGNNHSNGAYFSTKNGSISPREERVSQCCLDILISLFSWIPLSDFLNDSCIRCILKFAHLMSESGLSITALSCINEVYNRKYMPREIGIFINLTFNSLLDIMKLLVAGDPKVSLARSDENFIVKFTEFTYLFFKNHLVRCLESGFPITLLLEVFLKYTHAQSDHEVMARCLEIWKELLVEMARNPALGQFSPIYGNVCVMVVEKIQMRENSHFLSEIDDSITDSEGLSEWDIFINNCAELISKISEHFPKDVLGILDPLVQKNMESILRSEFASSNGNRIDGSSFIVLRDLRVLFRIYGRICISVFVNEKLNYQFNASADAINEKLLLFGQLLLFKMKEFSNNSEVEKLVDQVMTTCSSYLEWLKLCLQINPTYWTLYSSLVEMALAFIRANANDRVSISSSNLLFHITRSIKTTKFLEIACVADFLPEFTNVYLQISASCGIPLAKAFCNIYILNCDEQNVTQTVQGLSVLFGRLLSFPTFVQNAQDRERVKRTLSIMQLLSELVKEENTTRKKAFMQFIGDSAQRMVSLVEIFSQDPEILEKLLQTHLAVFTALKAQIGIDHISETSQKYYSILGNSDWINLLTSNPNCVGTMNRFFAYLNFLTEEPGKGFGAFTEFIVDFVSFQVYEFMKKSNIQDINGILSSFYRLVRSILLLKFNAFFPSLIRRDLPAPLASKLNPMMETLLFSFKQADIEVFKYNLETLGLLNERNNLFKQSQFVENMLPSFVSILMEVLIQKSHDLLRDEVISCIFQLSQSDNFVYLNDQYLPGFLANASIPIESKNRFCNSFRACQDYPSFSLELQTFMNDCIFWQTQG